SRTRFRPLLVAFRRSDLVARTDHDSDRTYQSHGASALAHDSTLREHVRRREGHDDVSNSHVLIRAGYIHGPARVRSILTSVHIHAAHLDLYQWSSRSRALTALSLRV